MRDIIYYELRECNRHIRKLEDECERQQGYRLLIETIEKMCEISNIARKEGLLLLEEAAYNLGDFHNKDFLADMILLIIDGCAPELVEELGTAKYFSSGMEGADALQYLIMLFGCLAIQAGENTRLIEEKLLSLAPLELVNEYKNKKNGY